MIQPVICFNSRILTVIGLLTVLFFPRAGWSDESEYQIGTYLDTVRNLTTRGTILAYRYWLTSDEGTPGLCYPRPLTWGLEVRGGLLAEPEHAGEAALLLNLRFQGLNRAGYGFYIFAGLGGSYSGVDYEKTSDWNFISRGGLGLVFQEFIVQGAIEHRSNAGLSSPNRGLDLVTGSVGLRF